MADASWRTFRLEDRRKKGRGEWTSGRDSLLSSRYIHSLSPLDSRGRRLFTRAPKTTSPLRGGYPGQPQWGDRASPGRAAGVLTGRDCPIGGSVQRTNARAFRRPCFMPAKVYRRHAVEVLAALECGVWGWKGAGNFRADLFVHEGGDGFSGPEG